MSLIKFIKTKKQPLIFGGLLFLFLAGCAKVEKKPELETITLAFQPWVGYGLFFLADEKGFLGEEGIRIKFVDEPLDSARRDAFKQGMLDAEGGTIDLLVSKIAQDTPIVTVMGIDHSYGGDGIVVTEEIKIVKDLIGKRVALSRGNVGEMLLAYIFHKHGFSLNDVTIIPTGPQESWEAFVAGEADAVVTWNPFLSKALTRPGAHILTTTKEYPDVIVDMLNVHKNLVENKPELLKGLMRAWYKALDYYRKNPIEASEIIAIYYEISSQEYREQIEGLRWIDYEEACSGHGQERIKRAFRDIAEIKFKRKAISKIPKAEKAIDYYLWGELYENSQ